MDFEVEPTRVSHRSKALPTLAGAMIVLVLGTAVLIGDRDRGSVTREPAAPIPSVAFNANSAVATPVPPEAPAAVAQDMSRPRRAFEPALVHCHDLSRAECIEIARAAVDIVQAGGSPTDRVDVWPSILCSDLFDCPLETLARIQPLGSAVVHIEGRKTVAWVNVGANASHAPPHPTDPPAEAWIVRWFY